MNNYLRHRIHGPAFFYDPRWHRKAQIFAVIMLGVLMLAVFALPTIYRLGAGWQEVVVNADNGAAFASSTKTDVIDYFPRQFVNQATDAEEHAATF